jgi:hypothetical protein
MKTGTKQPRVGRHSNFKISTIRRVCSRRSLPFPHSASCRAEVPHWRVGIPRWILSGQIRPNPAKSDQIRVKKFKNPSSAPILLGLRHPRLLVAPKSDEGGLKK